MALLAGVPAASLALAQDADATPFDWSVGLRGQYSLDSAGSHLQAILAPEASLNLINSTGTTSLSGAGEFSLDDTGTAHIDSLKASAKADYQIDAITSFSGSADLSLTQLKPDDSSLPANTAIAPIELTGTVSASAKRKFGALDITGTAAGGRFIEGPTTLDDSSVIDNADQSYWQGGGKVRAAVEVTPLLSVFAEGEQSYQKYDAPSPTLLTFLDGKTTTLRAGISYDQGALFSGEASFGRAWLDYDAPSLVDRPSWVTDASVSFSPDDTTILTGALTTKLGPSGTVFGDTDAVTTASANGKYQLNSWMALRGSANWDRTLTLGTGDISTGYSLGAGFDFASSRHATWSGDYVFAHDFTSPGPATDTHTVTVGLTIKN